MKMEALEIGFKAAEPFENAQFRFVYCMDGRNGSFGKRRRKKRHFLSFPSAFSVALVWKIGENLEKSMRFRMKRINVDW